MQHFEGNGRLSQAIVNGDTIYFSGQTSRDGGTVAEQTKAVLNKIDVLLEKYGSDKKHILNAQIFLRDMRDFQEMNTVWDAWVEKRYEPTRACVEARLAADIIGVEIVIIAAKK